MRIVAFYFLILIGINSHTILATQNSSLLKGGSQEVSELLNKAPKYKKDSKAQATVGVIPYRTSPNQALMLGYEVKDETWSDFGGKFDETKDHSFLDAMEREYFEETGAAKSAIIRLAALDPCTIILYLDKAGKREVIYLFYKVDAEIKFFPNAEKSAAKWFNLSHIISYRQNEDNDFCLRKYLIDDLLNSDKFDQIVKFLRTQ